MSTETVTALTLNEDVTVQSGLRRDTISSLDEPERSTSKRYRIQDEDREWRLDSKLLEKYKKDPEEIKTLKKSKVGKFYIQQNERIDALLQLEEGKTLDDEEIEKSKTKVKIAIYVSFIANIVLFCLKIVAAVQSGSLSVAASALDSSLDLLSGSILFLTNYFIKKENVYLYPAGKKRLEPIGIIIFAAVMFTATFQLLISAVQRLISKDTDINLTIFTICIIVGTVIVKFLLFLYCRLIKDSPSVEALAQDHRNDVLSNTVGVGAALLGYYYLWWADGVGGILIGLYIMTNWFRTGFTLVKNLTGRTADPEFLQQLTYVAWNHDKRVLEIDTVRAFYLGTGFLVEVDIVLPEDMSLREAHDIGEELQFKLEKVPNVERAFVHLDWNSQHQPEH